MDWGSEVPRRSTHQIQVPASLLAIMPLKSGDRHSHLVVLESGLAHLQHLHCPLHRHKIPRTPLPDLGVCQGQASRMLKGHRSRNRRWAYFRGLLLLGQVRQDILLAQV